MSMFALYTFTYFCAHISPSKFYIYTRPFICTCLHTTMPIYLYMYIYFYAHISLHFYILLRPYSDICLYTTTSIYALHTFTYLYAHIRLIYAYILLCPEIYYCPYLRRHIYICLDTSTPIYLNMYTYCV